jgi:dihydroxyacetone kinase
MQRVLKFTNSPEDAIQDAICGMLWSNPLIMRVPGCPNVLVRRDVLDVKNQQVTILSGGGSGHEPAHAGYIGTGMLTGAILGILLIFNFLSI